MPDRIELLGPSLLHERRDTVEELRTLAHRLGVGLGWHYLIDLAWILREIPLTPGMTVLDAGAGTGLLQWYLAEHDVNVLSVDRISRASLPLRFRIPYRVRGLHRRDLNRLRVELRRELLDGRLLRESPRHVGTLARRAVGRRARGTITFHRSDLTKLTAVRDASIDYVVAVSALEHNPPDELAVAVSELVRVLRPGGLLAATVSASRDEDWFHEPAKGWCFTERTLRAKFAVDPGAASNYDHYDEIDAAVRSSSELRDNLASFYFKSGDNGMPWGVWDPKYLPVGVRREKAR